MEVCAFTHAEPAPISRKAGRFRQAQPGGLEGWSSPILPAFHPSIQKYQHGLAEI